MESVRDKSFTLNNSEYRFICEFVYNSTGIVLRDNKREMVYRRLTRIIRDRKIASFSEYCQLLKDNPEQESSYFTNAITTNLTSFFREKHHFDYLRQHYLPTLISNNKSKKRLRIWSSASSTGEEPYSLAMTVAESMKTVLPQWDAKILATDIDSNVLAKGKSGVYDLAKLEGIPNGLRDKYFHKGVGENANKVKVAPQLSDLITFKKLNLLHEWPMKGPFDVIFCRNVIIYFDKETQNDLFERYYDLLKPGGLLMLGHSENLGKYQKYFDCVGRTIFKKPS